jgi:hypothetical protein
MKKLIFLSKHIARFHTQIYKTASRSIFNKKEELEDVGTLTLT